MEGIDESLNMLKELQSKLKRKPQQERFSTEPNQMQQKNAFPLHMNLKHTSRSPRTPNRNTQPAHMENVENNQAEYAEIKDIMKENRRLKKYVNCLLQMNDYLKNQLVDRSQYTYNVQKNGNSFELDLMKMEIQYLKEINRDKELELKRSLYLAQHCTPKKKKHQRVASTGDFPTNKVKASNSHHHNRSISNSALFNPQQHEVGNPERYPPQNFSKANKSTKSKVLHGQTINGSNKKMKKKQPQQTVGSAWKKCRLCYI